jgi:hypothetical protein
MLLKILLFFVLEIQIITAKTNVMLDLCRHSDENRGLNNPWWISALSLFLGMTVLQWIAVKSNRA